MGGIVGKKKMTKDEKLLARVAEMLKKQKNAPRDDTSSWSRIVLKFGMINKKFLEVKTVFDAADQDASKAIEMEELHHTMLKLLKKRGKDEYTAKMKKDVGDVFVLADRSKDGALQFKEFLVCLALLHILEVVPPHWSDDDVEGTPDEQKVNGTNGSKLVRTVSEAAGLSLHAVFKLVIDAFLTFDDDASGFIEREEVMKMFSSKNNKGKSKAKKRKDSESVIGRQRWKEMDWNADGKISFSEFLFAFSGWTGLEDELEELEEQ